MAGTPNVLEVEVSVGGQPRTVVATRDDTSKDYLVTHDGEPLGRVAKDPLTKVHTRRWVAYDLQSRRTGFYPNLRFAIYNVGAGNGRPRRDP